MSHEPAAVEKSPTAAAAAAAPSTPERVSAPTIVRTTAIARTGSEPPEALPVREWIPLDLPALTEAKEAQVVLHADIVTLEQRAVRRLGRFTPATDEVRGLLQSAVDVGLKAHFT